MNPKTALHCRIYTREQISEDSARKILELFERHRLLDDAKFGSNEPTRHEFIGNDFQQAVELLTVQRSLIINNRKAGVSIFIMWFVNRKRPWFWTIDYDKKYLTSGSTHRIVSLCEDLLNDFEPLQIAAALSSDWFEKHDVKDEKGNLRQRVGASFELGRGLPGIYWLNGFGIQLSAYFEDQMKVAMTNAIVDHQSAQGWLFRTYPEPDSSDEGSRRAAEKFVLNALGDQYFFDLSDAHRHRPKKRLRIKDISDSTKL
jgi:hypothetical protein